MKKSRSLCGITYLPADDVLSIFSAKSDSGVLRSFAFILHDRDIWHGDKDHEDGSPKEPHIHFIVRLYSPTTISAVEGWFNSFCVSHSVEANTFASFCSSVSSYARYLVHADDPDKVQYLPEEVISNNLADFQIDADADTSFLALDDLLNGVSLRDVARRYGRDFIFHYGHIKALYYDILKFESED